MSHKMAGKGPQQIRAEERREKKLEEIAEQVEAGTLTVRQMTPAERKKYPAPPPKPEGKGKKRSR
jgi:hypothetical protein